MGGYQQTLVGGVLRSGGNVELTYVKARGNRVERDQRWELERALEERDGPGCFYCGAHNETVDHVQPRAHGGGDELSNLVLCCRDCNWKKSSAPAWFFAVKRELGVAA